MSEQDKLKELARMACAGLVNVARGIFVRCGAIDDFCLNRTSISVAIFGESNRLTWTARTGWDIDRSRCSQTFSTIWDRIKHEYGTWK